MEHAAPVCVYKSRVFFEDQQTLSGQVEWLHGILARA
jgi:hypothetical protein